MSVWHIGFYGRTFDYDIVIVRKFKGRMVETDKKREQIIEGAIKRFIHFGINKTTMNEIAEDLSVSKPSLYYYFPDKTSLILGVVEKIFNDYFDAANKELKEHLPIDVIIQKLIEVKHKFFQKYYMLHLSGGAPDSSLNSAELRNFIEKMRSKAIEFHAELFRMAIERGEIEQQDSTKIADLYMSSQNGLTSLCIMNGNKELMPGKKELKNMLERQLALAQLFIKGLKKQ
jgi:TetR/AcrR family transcriptional repressor of mexJK operon